MMSISSLGVVFGWRIELRSRPRPTSRMLCGGSSHAMPTRDARRAIKQQHRQARRQELRLLQASVVVRREIDGVLIDLGQQQIGDRRQPRFGIAIRRRGVAVARAEVALAVDQRIAQREVLRHAHERVVGRGVAVRMVFAEHLADDARRLRVLHAGAQAELVHRIENAALHRLLAVLDVRDRAAAHHAHRVSRDSCVPRTRAMSIESSPLPLLRLAAAEFAAAGARLGRRPSPTATASREEIRRRVVLLARRAAFLPRASHTSASTWSPFSSIHAQRASASRLRHQHVEDARAWCRGPRCAPAAARRVSGHIVVSHNCSGFISPSPLKR